jgi:DNA-binding NarL/FixJ family response regulator
MRVVIAEDLALLRDGLTRLLRASDIEVVAAVGDPDALTTALREQQPVDLAIVDVRMPPIFTSEGLSAAIAARAENPGLPVLVLRQYVERLYARELLRSGAGGIGYLPNDRVADVDAFLDAVHRDVAGSTVLDPKVVSGLLSHPERSEAIGRLTPREREVLGLMAEGVSNAAIGSALVITEKAVGKHISNIFMKLDLPDVPDQNRRVLAVLTYLQQQ